MTSEDRKQPQRRFMCPSCRMDKPVDVMVERPQRQPICYHCYLTMLRRREAT